MAGPQPTAASATTAAAARGSSEVMQQQEQEGEWGPSATGGRVAAAAGEGSPAPGGREGGGRGAAHAGEEAAPAAEPVALDLQAPLSAVHVRVEGLKKLQLSRIANEIEPLEKCRSVGELLSCLEATHRRLEELRVFSRAVSEVHCSSSNSREGERRQQSGRAGEEAAEPEGTAVDVLLRLQEKRASYVLGTYVDARGDVELEANAHIPAFFGGKETFSLSAAATPISSNTRLRLHADVHFPRLPLFLCRAGGALQQLLGRLRDATLQPARRSSSSTGSDSESSSSGVLSAAAAAAAASSSSSSSSPAFSSSSLPAAKAPFGSSSARAAAVPGAAAAAVALGGSGEDSFLGLRRGVLRAFSSQTSWAACSSFLLQQTGVAARLLSSTPVNTPQQHALEWSLTLRDVMPCCDATKIASAAVLASPLRSLKHALRYDFTLNRLDVPVQEQQEQSLGSTAAQLLSAATPLLPRQGYIVNANVEAAGPGGDTRFMKAEVHGFAATPLRFPSFGRARRTSSDARGSGSHSSSSADTASPSSSDGGYSHNTNASSSNSGSDISRRNSGSSNSSHSSSSSRETDASESPWVLSARVGCGVLLPGLARAGGRASARPFPSDSSSYPPYASSAAAEVNTETLSVCDRFRLTGPYGAAAALRGFKSYCVGPADTSHVLDPGTQRWRTSLDFLGGDTFLSSEICLSYDFQLPSFLRAAPSSGSSGSSSVGGSPSSSSGVRTPETHGGSGDAGASSTGRSSAFHPRFFLFGNVGALGDVFSTNHQHLQSPPALLPDVDGTAGFPAAGGETRGAAATAAGATRIRLLQQQRQRAAFSDSSSCIADPVLGEATAGGGAAANAAVAGGRRGRGAGRLQQVGSNLWNLLLNCRCAVGGGIALPVSKGIWIEGLVALPLRAAPQDETQRVQIGLRLASAGMTGD